MTGQCFTQKSHEVKISTPMCFACMGELSVIPMLVEAGHLYEKCSPLVEGESKNAPLRPMTSKDDCIRAFVGNCEIDATGWNVDSKTVVYTDVTVYKQAVNWPKNEDGSQIFTLDDLEHIYQGRSCCIKFFNIRGCEQAPPFVKNFNSNSHLK